MFGFAHHHVDHAVKEGLQGARDASPVHGGGHDQHITGENLLGDAVGVIDRLAADTAATALHATRTGGEFQVGHIDHVNADVFGKITGDGILHAFHKTACRLRNSTIPARTCIQDQDIHISLLFLCNTQGRQKCYRYPEIFERYSLASQLSTRSPSSFWSLSSTAQPSRSKTTTFLKRSRCRSKNSRLFMSVFGKP